MIRRVWIAGVVALALVTAGCGDDDGGPTMDHPEVEAEAEADMAGYAGLCESIALAAAGDIAAVTPAFDHGPLHGLAEDVTEIDRGLGARLLEAKEQVESALTDPATTPETLTSDLNALADAVREAQRALDVPELPQCPRSE